MLHGRKEENKRLCRRQNRVQVRVNHSGRMRGAELVWSSMILPSESVLGILLAPSQRDLFFYFPRFKYSDSNQFRNKGNTSARS